MNTSYKYSKNEQMAEMFGGGGRDIRKMYQHTDGAVKLPEPEIHLHW